MAIKSGVSHSMETLVLTIISALLIHLLNQAGIFEKTIDSLLSTSFKFSMWLDRATGIKIMHELFPVLFGAAILAFIWGVIFQLNRK